MRWILPLLAAALSGCQPEGPSPQEEPASSAEIGPPTMVIRAARVFDGDEVLAVSPVLV